MNSKIIVTLLGLSMVMFQTVQAQAYGYEFCPELFGGPDRCPDDAPVPNCDTNPCSNAVCEANGEALCLPIYCGYCTACFYMHDMLVDCELN